MATKSITNEFHLSLPGAIVLIMVVIILLMQLATPVMGVESVGLVQPDGTKTPPQASATVPASTSTLVPTKTPYPIPPQSDTVTFIYKDGEDPVGRKQIEDTINVAYPQYVDWGCGEFEVKIYSSADREWLQQRMPNAHKYYGDFEGYVVPGAIYFNTAWPAWIQYDALGWREIVVAHELASTCQYFLSQGQEDWSAFWSGGSRWMATQVIVPWLHHINGRRVFSIDEVNQRLLGEVKASCEDGVFSVTDNSVAVYVGNVAWNMLIGDDVSLWVAYYKNLSLMSKERAFKETFGITPGDFEREYIAACRNKFYTPTPTSTTVIDGGE